VSALTEFVIGLDLGTGGARALAVDALGRVLSSASHIFPTPFMDHTGVSEQVAGSWRIAAMASLKKCLQGVRAKGLDPGGLKAICVDGTSGTVVFLDAGDAPLYPGILHNDTRASEEARELNDLLGAHCEEVGYRFGATFALSKILWMQRHKPLLFERVKRIEHQCDYVIGHLTGNHGVSDPSNSLKTGYNLVHDQWPAQLADLGLLDLLPKVIPSGATMGRIRMDIAQGLGIPGETQVLAGVTDSTAGFLATGAALPGEFAVCLGTTLAFKGISKDLVQDPDGVVYCHRHPGGGWLPGGASNVGGACLKSLFGGRNLSALDHAVESCFPTDTLCYPLVETGERFPFNAPRAQGFFDPPSDEQDQYLSLLQGVALVEKWCFERFEALKIEIRFPVYTTGSGSRSDVWNQIRANILQRPLARPASTDPAMGVAILAASQVFYNGDLAKAGKAMAKIEKTYTPDPKWKGWSIEKLEEIRRRCFDHGWI
jgi:D-ribulokinase